MLRPWVALSPLEFEIAPRATGGQPERTYIILLGLWYVGPMCGSVYTLGRFCVPAGLVNNRHACQAQPRPVHLRGLAPRGLKTSVVLRLPGLLAADLYNARSFRCRSCDRCRTSGSQDSGGEDGV